MSKKTEALDMDKCKEKISLSNVKESNDSVIEEEIEEETITDQNYFAHEVFSIPLILKQILERLPKKELLTTSLVNTYWNLLSREVLRSDESSLATLDMGERGNFAEKLVKILTSENCPFNGLKVSGRMHNDDTVRVWDESVPSSQFVNEFLERVAVKYLTLKNYFLDELFHNFDPTKTNFLQGILKNTAQNLVGITIGAKLLHRREISRMHLFGPDFDENNFCLPNLKFLRLPYLYSDYGVNDSTNVTTCIDTFPSYWIRPFVTRSPNIQKIYGSTCVKNLEDCILARKSLRFLEDFVFHPLIAPLELVSRLALEGPKMKGLTFTTDFQIHPNPGILPDLPTSKVDQVAEILRSLIQSNESVLENFTASNLDLILLTQKWNVPAMKRVSKFRMHEVYYIPTNGFDNTFLRKMDWERVFPSLNTVFLRSSFWHKTPDTIFNQNFYVDAELVNSNVNYCCRSVSKLVVYIDGEDREDKNMLALSKDLFPNVITLEVNIHMNYQPIGTDSLQNFYGFWEDLQVYIIKINGHDRNFNLDAYFLGIGPQEAKFIQENADQLDPLSTLEIVRPKTGLLDFPKLKKLELHLTTHNYGECKEQTTPNHLFCVSHLIYPIVLSRLPELRMEVYRDNACCDLCPYSLEHLKPFDSQLILKKEENMQPFLVNS